MQEISETEFVGSASVLGGEATPQNIKSKDGTARSLGKWEITMHDCSLFQSTLLSPRGWQPEYCLLDSSSNLPEYKNCKKKKKEKRTLLSMFCQFLQHYLHCRWSARTERASMVGRATEGAWSGAESSTGPLRSASTTGASLAAPSMSVGQTSVQPLPLPEPPLPSSPAATKQNTSQTEHSTENETLFNY